MNNAERADEQKRLSAFPFGAESQFCEIAERRFGGFWSFHHRRLNRWLIFGAYLYGLLFCVLTAFCDLVLVYHLTSKNGYKRILTLYSYIWCIKLSTGKR
ncbi:MAG: hypothetical protein J6Q89_07615 [Clostridia bacterium]|nr:hypothetical protein [Clostridia bacterium]